MVVRHRRRSRVVGMGIFRRLVLVLVVGGRGAGAGGAVGRGGGSHGDHVLLGHDAAAAAAASKK